MVYAWTVDYTSNDPADERGGAGNHHMYHAYDSLVKYDPEVLAETGQYKLMPWLATSWEISPDGLTWTFQLRKGHHFYSSDNLVDAHAVKFTFDRLFYLQESLPTATGYVTEMIKSVEVIADYTIQFTLNYAYAPFLTVLVDTCTGIVDPAVMQHEVEGDMGNSYFVQGNPSMGSGQFILESWVPGEGAVFIANKEHWAPPKIDRVIIKYVKETTTQLMMLKRGDVDAAHNLAADQVIALEGTPGINIMPVLTNWCFKLWAPALWLPEEPTSNEKVRMALRYAVDYDEIIKLTMGYGRIQQNPISKGLIGFDPDLSYVYHRDLTKARQLLKEAGYPDGFKVDLNYETATKLGVAYEDVCLLIKDQLAEVGIECELRGYAPGAFWGTLAKDVDPDIEGIQHSMRGLMVSRNGALNPDGNSIASHVYYADGIQTVHYHNERLEELIMAERTTVDFEERMDIFRDIAWEYMGPDFGIWLFQGSELFAYRDSLTNVVFNNFIFGVDFTVIDKP